MDYKSIAPLAAYIDRIGAVQLNFRRFMVKEHKGHYYTERALIKLMSDGDIECSNEAFDPTEDERKAIKLIFPSLNFPKAIKAVSVNQLKPLTSGELYIFIDRRDKGIKMVQERRLINNEKVYLPWTFYSDGQWRCMEPEGALPLWKPELQLTPRIMIHEGAKAAKFCHELTIDDKRCREHPWGEFLKRYSHWGMIGGALAPHRSDYSEVTAESPTEVIYCCDNDWPGKTALSEVSRTYGRSLKGIMFDLRFPPSWDMADPMPKDFYSNGRYIGPDIDQFIQSATRATEKLEKLDKNLVITKRDFLEEWFHCLVPEVFIHRDWPNRIHSAKEFNSLVAPYSNVANTAGLVVKDAASKSGVLKYSPALASGIYGDNDRGRYVNTHLPSPIKAEAGDATPWFEFMEQLVVNKNDRFNLMKWCATLVARPELKMDYGVLMISEKQGVGKGTLGEKILCPLVGKDNTSFPSETEIVDSNFNAWLAHKRLAVVHEIYAGQSFKAYNRLKTIITDHTLSINKKFQSNYEIENWLHIFACSNSRRALRIAEDDRRWFIPELTEVKRNWNYWKGFNNWLSFEGGLSIIKHWCYDFLQSNAPVMPGESAPDSGLKQEVIEEGYSPGQSLVAGLIRMLTEEVVAGKLPKEIFILDKSLVNMIRNFIHEGKQNDRLEKPATVRKVARNCGWFIGKQKVWVREWGGFDSLGSRVIAFDEDVANMDPSIMYKSGDPATGRPKPFDLSDWAKQNLNHM